MADALSTNAASDPNSNALDTRVNHLHGQLDIKISNCRHLRPKIHGCGSFLPGFLVKDSTNISNQKLYSSSRLSSFWKMNGLCNPLVEVSIVHEINKRKHTICATQNRVNTLHPNFNERFSITICQPVKKIIFRVYDVKLSQAGRHYKQKKEFLGEFVVDGDTIAHECCSRTGMNGTFPLAPKNGNNYNLNLNVDLDRYASKWFRVRDVSKITYGKKGGHSLGWISLQIRFTSVERLNFLRHEFNKFHLGLNSPKRQDVNIPIPFYFAPDKHSLLMYPDILPLKAANRIVPETYFMPRFSEEFCIYLNAHQPGNVSVLSNKGALGSVGNKFEVRSFLVDISLALKNAKEFICISSSFFDHEYKLIQRGPGSSIEPTIGEILISKADEGVAVLILLLMDTSTKSQLVSKSLNFFNRRSSKVVCKLIGGNQLEKNIFVQGFDPALTSSSMLKRNMMDMIIVDTVPTSQVTLHVQENQNVKRKVEGLCCFLGGIPLHTSGYGDADKSIQPMNNNIGFPIIFGRNIHARQPRQKVYLKVSNKSAMDCLQAFFEIWLKRVGEMRTLDPLLLFSKRKQNSSLLRRVMCSLKGSIAEQHCVIDLLRSGYVDGGSSSSGHGSERSFAETLLQDSSRETDDSETVDPDENELKTLQKPTKTAEGRDLTVFSETFIQIIRTVNTNYSDFGHTLRFPNLSIQHGQSLDTSIMKAVIHGIRSSEKFIYIETEQLIGSISNWDLTEVGNRDLSRKSWFPFGDNPIPCELISKIVSKIQAKESFHLFLILSLIPRTTIEALGNAITLDVQKDLVEHNLLVQRLTLDHMFREVQSAISKAGNGKKPTDYISIFNLAKLEVHDFPIGTNARKVVIKYPISVESNILVVDDLTLITTPSAFTQTLFDPNYGAAVGAMITSFGNNNMVSEFRQTLLGEHLGFGELLNDCKFDLLGDKLSEEDAIAYLSGNADQLLEAFCLPEDAMPDASVAKKRLMKFPLEFDPSQGKFITTECSEIISKYLEVKLLGKEAMIFEN